MDFLTVPGIVLVICALALMLRETWFFVVERRQKGHQMQRNLATLHHRIGMTRGVMSQQYCGDSVGERWDGFKPFEVVKKVRENDDISSFYLRPLDNQRLAGFYPGQHVFVRAQIDGQQVPVTRAYTLSDSPDNHDSYRITVKRQSAPSDQPDVPCGVMSAHMVDNVQQGDRLNLSAPAGHFCLDTTSNAPIVMIASGVGITPFISMINAVANTDSDREMWLFYGTKDKQTQVMAHHFEALKQRCSKLNITLCYSSKAFGFTLDTIKNMSGNPVKSHLGRVDMALLKAQLPSNNYQFYLCGGQAMMTQMTDALRLWGVPDEDIHAEVFKRKSDALINSGQFRAPSEDTTVVFSRSGKRVTWRNSDAKTSILSLAELNNVYVDSACRAGECGMCRTKINRGEVIHMVENDDGTKTKGQTCLPCVAVPASREVVLDL